MAISAQHIHEFQLKNDLVYLNHAAVSPWPHRTVQAVQDFAAENLSHGSLNYLTWMETENALRSQLQSILNAPSVDDIALLKNTSEALSVVAYGINWTSNNNIVTSAQEFPSNRIVWESLKSTGVELRKVTLDAHSPGGVEDALLAACDENTRLLTISSIQFGDGLRIDLKKIGQFCQQNQILYCVDAIQSVGAVELDVQDIHADFVMADGHKWMAGPEGLAVFYCNSKVRDTLKLSQYGWHMTEDYLNFDCVEWDAAKTARRFECGSPNMLGIHALHASLSLLLEIGLDRIEEKLLQHSRLIMDLVHANNNLELLTPDIEGRYGGIVTFKHKSIDPAKLNQLLQANSIFAAPRGGGIRFSPHFYTLEEDIISVFKRIEDLT